MEDTNQIFIPDSFLQIYKHAFSGKLLLAWPQVCARYEHSEDLSHMLVDTASTMMHSLGIAERDVLDRVHAGLTTPDAGTSGPEAFWILQRLQELLGWSLPLDRYRPAKLDA